MLELVSGKRDSRPSQLTKKMSTTSSAVQSDDLHDIPVEPVAFRFVEASETCLGVGRTSQLPLRRAGEFRSKLSLEAVMLLDLHKSTSSVATEL